MAYFNYHATAKKLIREGKLINSKIITSGGETILLLYFDDIKHPVMTIKSYRIHEYVPLIGNPNAEAAPDRDESDEDEADETDNEQDEIDE